MLKRSLHILSLLLLALLVGCSEVIDLKVDESGGQLIIYGKITNEIEGNYVTVHRTGVLGKTPEPVTGALVVISNEFGDSEQLVPGDSGRYELRGDRLRGQVGVAYSLEVFTGGKTYRAAPQVMPENYGEDIMSFELGRAKTITSAGVTVEEDVAHISSRTEFGELPEEFYLRWDIEEAYTYLGTWLPLRHFPLSGGQVQCYVINDLNRQRIFLHNGLENRATSIPERLYVSRPIDKSFQTLHYFNLTRSSISKETYNYWRQLDAIVNRQGSIFDVPPAGVKGNIVADADDEEVLGFFEVASVDITRLPITRRDVPVFIFDECEKKGAAFLELFTVPRDCRQCLADEGIVDPTCLYCGILPNSSYTRPSYF